MPWSICSRTSRLSGKPIECREMLKHEPGMVEDDSHMAIPRLVETGPFPGYFPKDTPTSGWSHKTWKSQSRIDRAVTFRHLSGGNNSMPVSRRRSKNDREDSLKASTGCPGR